MGEVRMEVGEDMLDELFVWMEREVENGYDGVKKSM